MIDCFRKNCPFGLPSVPFVNVYQLCVYVCVCVCVRARASFFSFSFEGGMRDLIFFPIIAYLFTLYILVHEHDRRKHLRKM